MAKNQEAVTWLREAIRRRNAEAAVFAGCFEALEVALVRTLTLEGELASLRKRELHPDAGGPAAADARSAAAETSAARLGTPDGALRLELQAEKERSRELARAAERERVAAALAAAEAEGMRRERDEAERRLAGLQMEHSDLAEAPIPASQLMANPRLMVLKKAEADRVNELNKMHDEANARARAAERMIAAAAASAAAAAALEASSAGAGAAGATAGPRAGRGPEPVGPGAVDGAGAVAGAGGAGRSPLPRAPRHTLRANQGATNAVAFSEGGALLASAGDDKIVQLWDAASGSATGTLRGAAGALLDCCFSSDGSHLLACGADKQVRLWEVASGRLRLALAGHSERAVSCCFGGADGPGGPGISRAVSCGHDGSIRVWDLQRGAKVISMLCASNCAGVAAGCCGGAELLASGHFDGALRFWDGRTGEMTHEVTALHQQAHVAAVVAAPGGQPLLLTSGRDSALKLVDARTFAVARTLRSAAYRSGAGQARPCFSPDGRWVAAGGADGALHMWAVETGEAVAALRGHSAAVAAAAWGASGAPVATCDKNGVALLWE